MKKSVVGSLLRLAQAVTSGDDAVADGGWGDTGRIFSSENTPLGLKIVDQRPKKNLTAAAAGGDDGWGNAGAFFETRRAAQIPVEEAPLFSAQAEAGRD